MTCIKRKFVFRKKCISPFCYVLVQQSFRVSILSFCLFGQPVPIHLPCSPFLFTQTVAGDSPRRHFGQYIVSVQSCDKARHQEQATVFKEVHNGSGHLALNLESCGRLTFWILSDDGLMTSLFIKSKLWPDTTVHTLQKVLKHTLVIQPELQTPCCCSRISDAPGALCLHLCEDGELRMTQLFTQQHQWP